MGFFDDFGIVSASAKAKRKPPKPPTKAHAHLMRSTKRRERIAHTKEVRKVRAGIKRQVKHSVRRLLF